MLCIKGTIKYGNVSPRSSASLCVFRISFVVLLQAFHKSVNIIFVLAGGGEERTG